MSAEDDDKLNKSYNNTMGSTTSAFAPADEPPPVEAPVAAAGDGSTVVRSSYVPDRLAKSGFHPVMIFGTSLSGKSTLLTSLFAYIKSQANSLASIEIGEWLLPLDSPAGKQMHDFALHFFHKIVNDFINRAAAPSTRNEVPFFIPVILTPREGTGLRPVKFAFLESKGEWYQTVDTPGMFQAFREEVREVLAQFPNGVSVIHIAPARTRIDHHMEGRTISEEDLGLVGAIRNYERARRDKSLDRHLFLFAKWDKQTDIRHAEFNAPDVSHLRKLLDRTYNQSWTAYQNMDLGTGRGRRHFMQYSAGLMDADGVQMIADRDRPTLARYPRTLWNWLYANATASEGQAGLVMYPDVLPAVPRKPTIVDRLIMLLGVR